MPLTIGTRLGPYEIIAPLGAGGMGEVWKARDTRLNRIVAVKRLTGQCDERFEQEARAIAALNHPHICQIYDVGPDYLVLEYIEGETLAERLAKISRLKSQGSGLSPTEAVRLATQVADALETAHRKGLLHRDLKPGNIMVTEDGAAKLLDFGLAKLVTPNADVTRTAEGMVLGTPAYMAPEQTEGQPLDARSDVFSFGVVLYEMLSGSRPFGGTSIAGVLSAVRRDDPGPLQAPRALDRIVRRCLQKQPERRFQTMADVKAALEEAAGEPSATPATHQPSIAVLPFANMSADKENEYFSDGLAEEIINALAHIPDLKVTARTSAFAFRGKEQDIRQIAEALDVRTILEGSVRRAGNRIRVTAQLINAADGYHLWSERYDREMADVFALQDEIAQTIATALQVKLAAEPTEPRRHTPNLPAYEAFLKARYYMAKLTPASVARGKGFLEQAIALDSGFALAHCELGVYFVRYAILGLLPPRDAFPQARSAAQRALDLDAALPEAHAMLGMVAAAYDYDWPEAERRFRQAMAREPVPPEVRVGYGLFYHLVIGQPGDAVEELRRALREDPVNVLLRVQLGVCLDAAGQETEAEAELRQALELDEDFFPAISYLGSHYAFRGRLAEAVPFAERAYALAPLNLRYVGLLAGLLARTGELDRANGLFEKLGSGEAYGAPMGFVCFHLLRSDIDKAADWAEKAIQQRDPFVMVLSRLIRKALRSSARWPALARMMNLPQEGESLKSQV